MMSQESPFRLQSLSKGLTLSLRNALGAISGPLLAQLGNQPFFLLPLILMGQVWAFSGIFVSRPLELAFRNGCL